MRGSIANRIAGAMVLLLCWSGGHAQNDAQEVPFETALRSVPPEQLGDMLMAERRYVEATYVYSRAPMDAVLWNKIGVAWHHLFALREARSDYERALQLNPNYTDALNNLGAIYFAERNYRKAIRCYQQALRIAPDSAIYLVNLGTAYFAENKSRQGAAAYRKALALDPGVFDLNRLEIVQAAATGQQRAQLDFCIAELLAQSGQPDEALEFLRKAIAAGYRDHQRLMDDPALAKLRSAPAFATLVADLETR